MKNLKGIMGIFFLGLCLFPVASALQSAEREPNLPSSFFSIKVKYVDNLIAYTCEELMEEDSHWSLVKGQWDEECTFENVYKVDINSLPFRARAGDYSINVTEHGEISLEYSYGDSDFVARSDIKLKDFSLMVSNKALPEFELRLHGADNSTFNADATAIISL